MTSAVVDGTYTYEFGRIEEFSHREMMNFLAALVSLAAVKYIESPRPEDANGRYCIRSLRIRLDRPIDEHELRAELDQAAKQHICVPTRAVA